MIVENAKQHMATGFSTLSEYRNSSRSEALQEEYNKTYAKVMRNGKLVNILTSEIVKGDTILVQAGDKVPTDGVLFEGHIKVSQAALNGESRDENKTAADNLDEAESTDYASANKVFMGSVVTSGEGYMVVAGLYPLFGDVIHRIYHSLEIHGLDAHRAEMVRLQ